MMINTFHEASEGNRFAQYARRFLNTVTDFSVWRVTILSFRHCYFCCYSFFYVTFLRSDFSKDVGFVYKQKNTDDSWYNWSANSTTKTTTRSLPNKKKEKPHPVIHKTEFPWERSVRINPDSAGNNVKITWTCQTEDIVAQFVHFEKNDQSLFSVTDVPYMTIQWRFKSEKSKGICLFWHDYSSLHFDELWDF